MNKNANTTFSTLVALSLLAAGATAQSHDRGDGRRPCDVSMLRGLFLFKGTGFNPSATGNPVPKAIIESIRFNGDGTLVAETVTLVVLGQPPVRRGGTLGTYTLDSNCTGTITFSDGPAFDTFVNSPWLVSMIQTAPVPAVLQGDARFVSR